MQPKETRTILFTDRLKSARWNESDRVGPFPSNAIKLNLANVGVGRTQAHQMPILNLLLSCARVVTSASVIPIAFTKYFNNVRKIFSIFDHLPLSALVYFFSTPLLDIIFNLGNPGYPNQTNFPTALFIQSFARFWRWEFQKFAWSVGCCCGLLLPK